MEQLTLGQLVERLDALPPATPLYVSGFGSARRLGSVFRHRPFADGVALEPTPRENEDTAMAGAYTDYLRRAGFGLACSANGDDQHLSGWDTPVWVSTRHEVGFHAVTGVDEVKGAAVIRTTNLAPVQGPSPMRLTDEQAINRMRVEYLQRTGQDIELPAPVERQLLRFAVHGRSELLHQLADAREDLAGFENSLQARRDRVARLEQEAVRSDYFLGIRGDLPGVDPGFNGHDSCPENG